MKRSLRVLSLLLAVLIATASCPSALAAAPADAASAVLAQTPAPVFGAVGGEWVVIGLSRAGTDVPDGYFSDYYQRLSLSVYDMAGVLSARKYTEYARVVLALTALGRDAEDVGGYDLLAPLGEFDALTCQGVAAVIWALLALDSGGYAVPRAASGAQATRQDYLNWLLAAELSGGGWALSGSEADPDVTAMALTALAPYRASRTVSAAVDRGLAALSALQLPDGGFASFGTQTSESASQVIIALCTLGVSLTDARFVKSGGSAADALARFAVSGGYAHTAGGAVNQMATEQALLAQAAMARAASGRTALYDMTDVRGTGLSGKGDRVRVPAVCRAPATFSDTDGRSCRAAVSALYVRGIVNGRSASVYDPDASITRAEFAALISRALGLAEQTELPFTDVSKSSKLAGGVGAAYAAGIVNGYSSTRFAPSLAITHRQAAAMLSRAAALCGLTGYTAPDTGADYLTRGEMAEWLLALLCAAGLV